MLTDNTLLAFVIAGIVILLVIVLIFMATRHDRAVTAAGPIEELVIYEKRLEEKRLLMDDLGEEIEKRREAMAVVADIGAEVDGLRRQKEELLTEWESLREKRSEVQDVRREIEDAMIERQSIEAEIAPLRAEFLAVKERLEKAEGVDDRIESLNLEHRTLSEKVAEMREEMQRLEDAEKQVERLLARQSELETNCARLEGRFSAQGDELDELSARVARERDVLADAQTEQSRVAAQTAAEGLDLRRVQGEQGVLAEARSALEARLSELKAEIAKADAIEHRIVTLEHALDEMVGRVARERDVLAEVQTKQIHVAAQATAEELDLRRVKGEMNVLAESRSTLEAKLARLNGDIAKAEGRSVDGDEGETDKLRELQQIPPAIAAMADWPSAPLENEADALHRVERRLKAKGLDYPARTLRAFHTAMKVNETTQLAVLAGISGTGKSQLPRQYAAGMGIGFLQVPVQPRWDSPQDLMGFYNYIEKKFRPTDMARALWALDVLNNEDAVEDRMMMILLDEMNLARVEYYFSDFLSRLESRPTGLAVNDRNERKDAELELEIPNMQKPPRIFPGYNLLFAGTMNEDESTQSLSDKVVDRANILRFAAPKTINNGRAEHNVDKTLRLSRKTWEGWVRPVSEAQRDARVGQHVNTMVEIMKNFKRPFGHRLGRAMMAYVSNYPDAEGARRVEDALADQVEMRLLPKLRGVEVDAAAPQFSHLQKFVKQELGDELLAQAILDSIELATNTTGQFVWSGVSR